MSEKGKLRSYIRSQKELHRATLAARSEAIMARLESDERFLAARTVLAYHSLPDEVDTHALIDRWYRRKLILLPVVCGDTLRLRRYVGPEQMRTSSFRIEEPTGDDFTSYGAIDLALVPGMAFDAAGHRLGRGRGYYDRLFAHPAFSAVCKIGLCFDFQLLPQVPVESTDVPVDCVLSC